jgi:hypothetical protein
MKSEIRDLDRLDLDRLRAVVGLDESRRLLAKLEVKRQRLKTQLEDTEQEIREYLGRRPEVLELLASSHGRRAASPARRQRGWVQDQVKRVLAGAERALTPAEIRDRIAKRHPAEATKSLYLAIFQHLRRHAEFDQDGDGRWRLMR